MRIEWAVAIHGGIPESPGWTLTGVAQNGFIMTADQLPRSGVGWLFVCFRREPGDEFGGRYDYAITVRGPQGDQEPFPYAVEYTDVSDQPRLVSIERNHVPVPFWAEITEDGEYQVILSDSQGPRYAVSYRYSLLPSPEA